MVYSQSLKHEHSVRVNWNGQTDDLPMIFFSPYSPVWDPYEESYELNEAATMYHCGDIVEKLTERHELVGDMDVSALENGRPGSPSNVIDFDEEERLIDVVCLGLSYILV